MPILQSGNYVAGNEIAGSSLRPLAQLVVVPSAEILALFATPQIIVAAPPAGHANVLVGLSLHKAAGTAYVVDAGEDLRVNYTDESGLELAGIVSTGFLDQATDQIRWADAYGAASGNSDIVPVAEAPLVLSLLLGELATGDSDLGLQVFYRVVRTDQ